MALFHKIKKTSNFANALPIHAAHPNGQPQDSACQGKKTMSHYA